VIGLAIFAFREMFQRSTNLRYDDPGRALIAALELFMEYALQSLIWPVWTVLLLGGMGAGVLVELASRRWR